MPCHRMLFPWLIALASASATTSASASAVEPACAPVLAAFRAKAQAPQWSSVVESEGLRLEARRENGVVSGRIAGQPWRAMPGQAEAEQRLIDLIEQGEGTLAGCRADAGAAIDGQAITVYHYRLAVPGAPPDDVRLHVGADGRPYLQESGALRTRYRYGSAP